MKIDLPQISFYHYKEKIRQACALGEINMFNGIVLAIIASLLPLLFYNEEGYVLISFS